MKKKMFLKSIGQIPLPRVSETVRISTGPKRCTTHSRCWQHTDPSGSEELQGCCLVLVIKVLVEMACDPEPCYSFICPFVHGSARDDQSVICVSPHDGL